MSRNIPLPNHQQQKITVETVLLLFLDDQPTARTEVMID